MKYSKIVKKFIEGFEQKCDKLVKEFELGDNSKIRFMYHINTEGDNDTLYTDGDLYDILNYGSADYNFGSELFEKIHSGLDKLHVIMENQGQGIFKFYKVQ